MTDKRTVIARSMVRPVRDGEPNPRAVAESRSSAGIQGSEETGESFRGDSFQPKPEVDSETSLQLDLLSEMMNSSMPTVDKTEFDPNDHIGLQFIRRDNAGLAVSTKVVEVDDETGKVLLEFVHGGYEWVMPNIVQEALLSRVCDDDGSGFHSFKKVLNHKTEPGGRIMVELLWDTDEVT